MAHEFSKQAWVTYLGLACARPMSASIKVIFNLAWYVGKEIGLWEMQNGLWGNKMCTWTLEKSENPHHLIGIPNLFPHTCVNVYRRVFITHVNNTEYTVPSFRWQPLSSVLVAYNIGLWWWLVRNGKCSRVYYFLCHAKEFHARWTNKLKLGTSLGCGCCISVAWLVNC